jgi:hypothetical protein
LIFNSSLNVLHYLRQKPHPPLGLIDGDRTKDKLIFSDSTSLRCDSNDDLAAAAPLHCSARVSHGRLSERQHRIHDHPEIAHIEHVPIRLNCSRFGSTMKNACFTRSSVVASLSAAIVIILPPGLSTPQDRCKVSPPTVSNTTSIFGIGSSKRSA